MSSIRFDRSVNNKIVVRRHGAKVFKAPRRSAQTVSSLASRHTIGRASGQVVSSRGNSWLQATLYTKVDGLQAVWLRRKDITLRTPSKQLFTDDQGQALVNAIIRQDFMLFHRLLYLAEFIDRAQKKMGFSDAQAKSQGSPLRTPILVYQGLSNRLSLRQNKLKESKMLEIKEMIDPRWTSLAKKWAPYIAIPTTAPLAPVLAPAAAAAAIHKVTGLGIAPIVVGIIIGAAAILVIGTAVYFAFKPDYDESSRDLKISADLAELLNKTDPKTAKSIVDDLESQVDKAYNAGKISGTFSGIGKVVLYTGLAVGGFFAIDKLLESRKRAS